MPRLRRNVYCSAGAGWRLAVALTVITALPICTTVYAQKRPPLPNEPVATEGTIKQFYRGLNYVVVKTMDGVEHVYNFTKDLVVHGGRKPGVDALEGLREGTSVAVHYSTSGANASAQEIDVLGDEGLSFTEGVVTRIDRAKKEITIRFANGRTETFQMTSRAAAESEGLVEESGSTATRIVIYYGDESGHKVAHYFKKAP
jgi:hypothetical protein